MTSIAKDGCIHTDKYVIAHNKLLSLYDAGITSGEEFDTAVREDKEAWENSNVNK